ncbi:phosphoglucomutase, partial [Staphylococcus felis]|nr:phosphoglucomutase [Staphylococcus felis]
LLVIYKHTISQNGLTFKDVLEFIYQQIVRYQDVTLSPSYEGAAGQQKISEIMIHFRNDTSDSLLGLKIKTIEDYLS